MPSGYGGFNWSNVDIASVSNAHSAIVPGNGEGVVTLASPGHPIKDFNISSFNAGCLAGNPPQPVDCNILIRGKNSAGKFVATQVFSYSATKYPGTSGNPGAIFDFSTSFAGMVYMDALPYINGGNTPDSFWGYCTSIKASVET